MSIKGFERLLLLLFVASGFAGLIYQSIWSQYLGLVLGHAAYAQTLVLAMFMGGMALGAWLVSRRSGQWRNLILAYAVAEAAIGVMALLFHGLFLGYRDFTYATALPAIGSPLGVDLYLWGTSALLIAPQTILLGATFPLMSAAYLRIAPREDTRILGGLYFSNSIGAAFGALTSTFLLMPAVGMPGTMLTAGLLNLLVAFWAWAISKRLPSQTVVVASVLGGTDDANASRQNSRLAWLLLWAAAITGSTSFVYEIGWVRLLNQSMGSSLHSFELMLSAFILGLALGGRWIRQRSAAIHDVLRYAGVAQVLMGLAALVSLPVFANSFAWVGWLRSALQQSGSGYFLMSLGGSFIAIAVMVPAAFFAGMTLPLFTTAMLRSGSGESGIGRVYAANTLGAIAGVFAVVHLLIPGMGVQGAVTLAGVVDVLLGFVLLGKAAKFVRLPEYTVLGLASLGVLAFSLHFGKPDPRSQAAGAFRTGLVRYDDSVVVDFIRDGKTATVSVVTDTGGARIIATNGKSDAGLKMADGEPFADEVTMVMAGALPVLLKPDAERIAFIGWGSGLSTHTALGSSRPRHVETVEIERAMYDGAKYFGPRVERAYSDPRSTVFFNDARTHFARNQNRYDVIVSEPSNPWVAGVASLFTHEFYRSMVPHLESDGVFVQWLHTYEINDRLFATMMAALLDVFPSVDTYLSTSGDMIFIASMQSRIPALNLDAVDSDVMKQEMSRVGLGTTHDWQLRRIGNTETLKAFVRMMRVSPHSDFFPVVSEQAPASMFKGERSLILRELAENGLPILDALIGRTPPGLFPELTKHQDSLLAQKTLLAGEVIESLRSGRVTPALFAIGPDVAGDVALLQQRSGSTEIGACTASWMAALSRLAESSIGFLPASDHAGVWEIDALAPDAVDASNETCRMLVAVYQGLSVRDFAAAAGKARNLLSGDTNQIPVETQEHLLIAILLDAAVRRQYEEVMGIESNLGRGIAPSAKWMPIRSLIFAWAELGAHKGIAIAD